MSKQWATVADVIAALQKLPQELEVVSPDRDGVYYAFPITLLQLHVCEAWMTIYDDYLCYDEDYKNMTAERQAEYERVVVIKG